MDLGRGWCVNKDVCVCVCVCVCVNCELTKAFKVHLCHRPKHSVCLLCKLVLRAGSVFLWGGFSTSCSHWAQGRSGTTLQVKEITFLRSTRMDISFDHFFQNTTFYILVPSWKKKKNKPSKASIYLYSVWMNQLLHRRFFIPAPSREKYEHPTSDRVVPLYPQGGRCLIQI